MRGLKTIKKRLFLVSLVFFVAGCAPKYEVDYLVIDNNYVRCRTESRLNAQQCFEELQKKSVLSGENHNLEIIQNVWIVDE